MITYIMIYMAIQRGQLPMPFVVVVPASSSGAPAPHSAHYPVFALSSFAVSRDCPERTRSSYRSVSLLPLYSTHLALLNLWSSLDREHTFLT